MQGGKHHEPSVLTHFVPGFLAGFVIGGVVGTLVIAHIATSSLQLFWQSMHASRSLPVACTDISGLHISSQTTDTGSTLTTLTLGDGNETLLTIPSAQLRYVPIAKENAAYLASVASPNQQSAFPATSLYRIDFCAKTITHELGTSEDPVEIVGLSASGEWVIYTRSGVLSLMQTNDRKVLTAQTIPSLVSEVLFSPREDAVEVRTEAGECVVWEMGTHGEHSSERSLGACVELPAWNGETALTSAENL